MIVIAHHRKDPVNYYSVVFWKGWHNASSLFYSARLFATILFRTTLFRFFFPTFLVIYFVFFLFSRLTSRSSHCPPPPPSSTNPPFRLSPLRLWVPTTTNSANDWSTRTTSHHEWNRLILSHSLWSLYFPLGCIISSFPCLGTVLLFQALPKKIPPVQTKIPWGWDRSLAHRSSKSRELTKTFTWFEAPFNCYYKADYQMLMWFSSD